MTNTEIDKIRLEANTKLDPGRKGQLGQFMTPSNIAEFMAELLDKTKDEISLLDAGAGIGSLAIAAVKKLKTVSSVEAWELDSIMSSYLETSLQRLNVAHVIHHADFIDEAVLNLELGIGTRFTHAVLNPPYKKINSNSIHRKLLRKVGIETVNLYSAFLALSILLMKNGGQIVAIIPRSFCNGPYYKPFREIMLKQCAIDHIHVFESRNKAFKDDEVLQENVILKIVKGEKQSDVIISTSHDNSLSDYEERIVSFSNVVKTVDKEYFVHIPVKKQEFDHEGLFKLGLKELGLEVSTGPVVDFRMKDFWQQEPTEDSIPLLYPHHFVNGEFQYPKAHKKPNALKPGDQVNKWLMPNGFYVIVKRFSAKEERRRVVAYIVDPGKIKSTHIGFENHWNVFHFKKHGLDAQVARGLACFLNSTELDSYFRVFSGHTQVNATDLKNMKYPSLETLTNLGKKFKPTMSQEEIDSLVASA